MFGADPLGPRFNIVILRDSHLYGYNLGSAGPLRHLGAMLDKRLQKAGYCCDLSLFLRNPDTVSRKGCPLQCGNFFGMREILLDLPQGTLQVDILNRAGFAGDPNS